MTAISKSTTVAGPIAPSDTNDTYATHFAKYGNGGFMSVANEAARDALPVDRREEGMWVQQLDNSTFWRLMGGVANGNWEEVTMTMANIIGLAAALLTKENSLGNPPGTGYALTSTPEGVRIWEAIPGLGGNSLIGSTTWTPEEVLGVSEVLKFIGENIYGNGSIGNGYSVTGGQGKFYYSENSVTYNGTKKGFYTKVGVNQFTGGSPQLTIIGFTDSVGFPPQAGMGIGLYYTPAVVATSGYIEVDFVNNSDVISNGGTINPNATINSWSYSYNSLGFTVTVDGVLYDHPPMPFINLTMAGMQTWQMLLNAINAAFVTASAPCVATFNGSKIRITSNSTGATSTVSTADWGANYLWAWGNGSIGTPVNGVAGSSALAQYQLGNMIPGSTDQTALTTLSMNETTEIGIAITTEGTHGKVYLYTNGTLLDSYELVDPLGFTVDQMAVYLAGSDTINYEILVTPAFTPFAQFMTLAVGAGIVDTASYPADRINKSFECSGMTIPLMSLKGLIDNGDIVIFNSSGELLTPLT